MIPNRLTPRFTALPQKMLLLPRSFAWNPSLHPQVAKTHTAPAAGISLSPDFLSSKVLIRDVSLKRREGPGTPLAKNHRPDKRPLTSLELHVQPRSTTGLPGSCQILCQITPGVKESSVNRLQRNCEYSDCRTMRLREDKCSETCWRPSKNKTAGSRSLPAVCIAPSIIF